jgi:hypothetical protein
MAVTNPVKKDFVKASGKVSNLKLMAAIATILTTFATPGSGFQYFHRVSQRRRIAVPHNSTVVAYATESKE